MELVCEGLACVRERPQEVLLANHDRKGLADWLSGFAGFQIISNDFNVFGGFLPEKNDLGVVFLREKGPCQATATTTHRAFRDCQY